jgi:hypothetical protein
VRRDRLVNLLNDSMALHGDGLALPSGTGLTGQTRNLASSLALPLLRHAEFILQAVGTACPCAYRAKHRRFARSAAASPHAQLKVSSHLAAPRSCSPKSTARQDRPPLRLCTRCKDEFWYCSKTCCVSSIAHECCLVTDGAPGKGLEATPSAMCSYYRALTTSSDQGRD